MNKLIKIHLVSTGICPLIRDMDWSICNGLPAKDIDTFDVYLTSDEKVREGDWYWYKDEEGYEHIFNWCKDTIDNTASKGRKIIASTNPNLLGKKTTGEEYLGGGQYVKTFNTTVGVAKIPYHLINLIVANDGKLKEILVEYSMEEQPTVKRNPLGEVMWSTPKQTDLKVKATEDDITKALWDGGVKAVDLYECLRELTSKFEIYHKS